MSQKGSAPIVLTRHGPVQGKRKKPFIGDEHFLFLRIPYAAPPIGASRFAEPREPAAWTEPLDCTKEGPPAFSFNDFVYSVVGSEDCLHVNVFTKNVKPKTLYPVLCYIHGGTFVSGSSSTTFHGPDYLLQKDVVFVSFNYRLGALGFLSLADAELGVAGNMGLKDQVLALKWVRDNIEAFGGDPKRITLFGGDAGSVSVHYHLLSDMSKGLFQRAILISGSAFNPWALIPPSDWAKRLAKRLGWKEENGSTERDILAYLRTAEPKDIVLAQGRLLTEEEKLDGILHPFGPIIEPYSGTQCFLPESPVAISCRAWSRDIDIVVGGCADEGLYLYKTIKPKLFEQLADFEHLVPLDLESDRQSEKCKTLGQAIRRFYYGDATTPSMDNADVFVRLLGDRFFWHGLHRAVLARLRQPGAGATYLFRFAIESPTHNFLKFIYAEPDVPGTSHGDEIPFLFSNTLGRAPDRGTWEYEAMQRMVDFCARFAIEGRPSGGVEGDWPLAKQPPPYECMAIGNNEWRRATLPESDRMAFWDSLYAPSQLY